MTVPHSVSVMVAAFNEVHALEGAVTDVLAALHDFAEYEIIIVDDGSTDGTATLADRLSAEHPAVRVVHHPVNRGIAAVYRTGLEAATKTYFTWVGGDREIAAESVSAILHAIGQAELVIPYHATPEARAWHRRLVTWLSTQQINVLFGWPLHYYQGPTVYPRQLALTIPVQNRGFFFASEMLIRALARGLTWVEVGLKHQERQHGTSNAVKLTHLLSAQLSVLGLWSSLRLGIGRTASPQTPPGTSGVPAICTAEKELSFD